MDSLVVQRLCYSLQRIYVREKRWEKVYYGKRFVTKFFRDMDLGRGLGTQHAIRPLSLVLSCFFPSAYYRCAVHAIPVTMTHLAHHLPRCQLHSIHCQKTFPTSHVNFYKHKPLALSLGSIYLLFLSRNVLFFFSYYQRSYIKGAWKEAAINEDD